MKERGVNELIAIDEAKVLEMVKKAQAFDTIKDKLVIGYDESKNDKSCLMLGVKDNNGSFGGTLFVFYETFEKEKVDLFKEVLNYGK